jgi:class 3 adenylate cyclase
MPDSSDSAGSVATVAVLFADLDGSTRLYERLGDEPAQRLVAGCLAAMADRVERHGGRVIKTLGDGVMSTFPTANQAADAAIAIVLEVREHDDLHGGSLGAHVGFHLGRVLCERGDVFGDTVNLASRLVSLATAGEILATRAAVDALAPRLRRQSRRIDRREIEGKQGEYEIFALIWQSADVTALVGVPERALAGRLVLRLGDDRVELGEGGLALTIGRDPENDLVLADPRASRCHARVAMRRGKFVLIDESTNGTVVRTGEGRTVRLHREELILDGSGSIGIESGSDATAEHSIAFRVEPRSGQ